MRWNLEHGDPTCRYCNSTKGKCPVHKHAPPVTPLALWYLRLYMRVKRWKALPNGGGILDQEERTMRILDLVAGVVEGYEREQMKLAQQRRANEETMQKLKRRR